MRIVAGKYRGRAIAAPKNKATRPTSDRARETLFNVLAHADFAPPIEGARVMDVFAGSGALGLEALSRGAGFCLFVETANAARNSIRQNMQGIGLSESAQLYRRGALELGRNPAGLGGGFSFAFIDPPYERDLVSPCLKGLMSGGWLTKDALIIAETSVNETLNVPETTLIADRTIGAAKVWFLKQTSAI